MGTTAVLPGMRAVGQQEPDGAQPGSGGLAARIPVHCVLRFQSPTEDERMQSFPGPL